jgi:elongation factor G
VNESNTQIRPVICVAIRPRDENDRDKLQRALSDLRREDLTIRIASGNTDGEIIISGIGALHLEIICDRIVREYKIPLDVGEFKVINLETIRKPAEGEGKYIRQTGGRGQYAHVKIRLEPREVGSGYEFVDEIRDGAVPPKFVEPINIGIQEAMKGGVLAGHEMVDLRAMLYDGSYHDVDSSEMAFQIAGSMAFKEAARQANPVVLEPLMAVEVVTPEEFAGSILGDLSSRRGRIEGMEHRADRQVIRATVPLATMIDYAQHMRSITQGRVEYSMNFARYEQAPRGGESKSWGWLCRCAMGRRVLAIPVWIRRRLLHQPITSERPLRLGQSVRQNQHHSRKEQGVEEIVQALNLFAGAC